MKKNESRLSNGDHDPHRDRDPGEGVYPQSSSRIQRSGAGAYPIHPKFEPLQPSFASRHITVTAQYLQYESSFLDLVTIQFYRRLIEIYGEELDQQITSETILTQIKNLVYERFEQDNLWEESAQEIWSSLVLRAIQEMQQDLGNAVLESLDWAEFNRILAQYLFDEEGTETTNKIRYLEAFYAKTIATRITQDLNLVNQPITTLKRLLKIRTTASPSPNWLLEESPTQTSPIAEIPSAFPTFSREDETGTVSFSDQVQADLWDLDAKNMAYLRYHSRYQRNHYLEHYITNASDLQLLPWETTEQLISKFGMNAAKLHCLLAAYTMQQRLPWESAFTLSLSQLLSRMGWSVGRTVDQESQRHQLTGLAYALSCVLIKIVWADAGDASKGGGASQRPSSQAIAAPVGKLWDVLIEPQGQFDHTTGRIEHATEVYLTIRPGLWITRLSDQAEPWVSGALHQFGQIASTMLEADAFQEEFVLRLVLHLMLDVRIQASDAKPYEYQVKSLLEALLSPEDLRQVQTHLDSAHDLFDRWNQALALLDRLGWKSSANPSFYISPYPKWIESNAEMRKPRGWVNTWLEQKLMIKPRFTQRHQVASS